MQFIETPPTANICNALQMVLRASALLDAWHLAMRPAPDVCQACIPTTPSGPL
jgi:hypothetical protein